MHSGNNNYENLGRPLIKRLCLNKDGEVRSRQLVGLVEETHSTSESLNNISTNQLCMQSLKQQLNYLPRPAV